VDSEEIFDVIHEQKGLSFEEFKALVERKVDMMGGLCDYETAAKMVASDMGVNPEVEFKDIGEVSPDDEFVSFVGKVVHVGDSQEFSRDDGTVGRVANLHLADSTGEIRVAVWDEVADLVKVGEIEEGEVLRVDNAKVKEGRGGEPEVSVGGSTELQRDDSEVDVEETFVSVGDLEPGLGAVHVRGEVLDVGDIRTFERDDGSEGRVASMSIGDGEGRVAVSLWGENSDLVDSFSPGDSVEVKYGYTRERYGETELHVGSRGTVQESEVEVEYRDRFTPVDDVLGEGSYDVKGRVLAVDDLHTFSRDDGSEGKVRNVHLGDDSGRIRAAFWDDKAEEVGDVEAGDTLMLRDAKGRTGQDGTPELSVGWSGSFEVVDRDEGEVYSGPIGGLEGGQKAVLRGQVVTWDGVMDDGTGCVRTEGKMLPFGRTMEVEGVVEERDGDLAFKVEGAELLSPDEGEVRELLDRLS